LWCGFLKVVKLRVATDKEAAGTGVPSAKVEVITSKV
jgi:hypothetical protein